MDRLIELHPNGTIIKDVDLREPNKRWQHPWHLVHRVNLHEKLKKLATSKKGVGIPAQLHTSSKVMDVDTAQGLITLANGETVAADVIIGADGIYVSATTMLVKLSVANQDLLCLGGNEKVHQGRQVVQLW